MTYQFREHPSNPRPSLPATWQQIDRQELVKTAPSCAGKFLSEIDMQFPELAKALVLLRHPEDRDLFAFCEGPPCGLGIQFDVDLEYIIIWSLTGASQSAEFGDWGDGEDVQIQEAIDHVRRIGTAT